MQPLKILAFVIGGLPVAAFLLTLFLTEGAPLRPLSPGEESGPAVVTPALPRAITERQDGVAAAGHRTGAIPFGGHRRAEDPLSAEQAIVPTPMGGTDRDAEVLIMLFGVPQTGAPPDR